MYYKKQNLVEGFAYAEVKGIYDTNKDGSPLVSKTGFPMVRITWEVVDKDGNLGNVFMNIAPNAEHVIRNIENVLEISNFFDHQTRSFNLNLVRKAHCGVVLKEEPPYGMKIVKLLPLDWYKFANELRNRQPKASPNPMKAAAVQHVKNSYATEDDDIPF